MSTKSSSIYDNVRYGNCLPNLYEYLKSEKKSSLTMAIGLSVVNICDVERNLQFDIKMSDYSFEKMDFEEYLEKTPEELISSFIFNYDFNSYCIINSIIITKFSGINKIKTIVFDSSTFKFLNNIKFVGLLYYLTLETNGEIYIESNGPMSVGFVINNTSDLYNYVELDQFGFSYQSAYLISDCILSGCSPDKLEKVQKHIFNRNQVYTHNLEYLQKWFYGSKVELCEDECYPIENSKYPIKKYYKITKVLPHNEILEKIKLNVKEYDEGLGLRSYSILKC